MIQGKWFAPGEDLSIAVIPVRKAVFGAGEDALDRISWNAAVFEDSVPVATGRIWWEDGSFRLGSLGVIESRRSMGYGDLVLRLLLYKAQSHYAREVRLSCPRDTVGFFGRLGLQECPSENPDTVEMLIPGERINLDSCKNCPKTSCPNRT